MKQLDRNINILFAEDLAADLEMATRLLSKEGIQYTYKVVDTEQDFIKELQDFYPDIVVSDYLMPAFDGMKALQIVRSLPEYLPFIILTGSMNEETAVKCMKAGANDYVIKEQITRLPFAILEAIEKQQERKEKEQIQKQLLESEKKFRDLFFDHSAIKLIIDPNTLDIVEANKAAALFYGWSIEELETMKISDINTLPYDVLLNEASGVVGQNNTHFEFKHRKANGNMVDVEVFSSKVKIGGKDFLHSIIHDISDRKKIEKIQKFIYSVSQLSLSNLNLKEYISAIHQELNKIMKADNFYATLYNSEADNYILPYYVDEFDDFTTDEPVSLKNTLTDYVCKSGEARLITFEEEYELREKENIAMIGKHSKVWIGAPLINSLTSEVTGIIALQDYEDINAYKDSDLDTLKIIAANIGIFIERIKNLENLKNSESRFVSFLNSSTDIVQLEDENNRMLFANKALLNILGIKLEEAIGKTVFDLFPEDLAQNCHISDKQARESENTIKCEEIWGDKIFETLKFPVDLGNGKIGIGAFIRDITEKKKLMEDLITAKEKAEEGEKLKAAFLANMSHEIRTPMNGILGFANLLKEQDYSDEEKSQFIEIIQKSGQRMLNTLNNIVEISRIETGNISVAHSETNLNEKIEDLVSFFKAEAAEKNLQLILDNLLPENRAVIITDKLKIESIFTNLIKNAIKYTRKGTVNVGCSIDDAAFMFYVKDTGIGIPENRRVAIFNRFEQADIYDSMALEGSGLGLAICKSYVELLDGKIWVESEEGKGSSFFIMIPIKKDTVT